VRHHNVEARPRQHFFCLETSITDYSQVIVVYQVHGCTKNTYFIKSKNFSCSVGLSSTLTGADVLRGRGWVLVKCVQGEGSKNGHFCGRPLWTAP